MERKIDEMILWLGWFVVSGGIYLNIINKWSEINGVEDFNNKWMKISKIKI